MKKFIVISILLHFIFSFFVLFAQDIHKAELRYVKFFPVGNGNGEIGWGTGTDPEPKSVCFDKNGFLYITDGANTRLCVFDSSFNWVTNIKTRNGDLLASKISIDVNGDIVGIDGTASITKINKLGNTIFRIFTPSDKIHDINGKIRGDGFYILGNFVVAYLRNGEIIGYENPGPDADENNKGPLLRNQELLERIERVHWATRIEYPTAENENQGLKKSSKTGSQQPEKRQEPIIRLGESFVGERRIKNITEQAKTMNDIKSSKSSAVQDLSVFSKKLNTRLDALSFVGKDGIGNTYWESGMFDNTGTPIIIYDGTGVFQKVISVDYKAEVHRIAVTNEGYLYAFFSSPKGHSIYKVERSW